MRLAVDAPAGLVGVQDGAAVGLVNNPLVPRLEVVGQAMPHLGESAFGKRQVEERVENRDDLAQRVAETVVQPAGERQRPVADGGAGQGAGDFRLDAFFAARAVV